MLELEGRIREAIGPIAGLATAVLFGSRATGKARPESDLDVAILPATGAGADRRRLQIAVAVALADLAPEGRVDVVFVDEAPVVLRQRIMEQAKMILDREPALWKEWRVRTMREYGDSEWARELYRQAQHRRLTEGRGNGRPGRALVSLERSRNLPR